jgi:hypothetical protein
VRLVEVGLWFILLLSISPEVREAHLLTLFTPVLALLALAATDGLDRAGGLLVGVAIALGFASIVAGAKIFEEAIYHRWWWVHGGPTWLIVLTLAASVVALLRAGHKEALKMPTAGVNQG